MTKLAVSLNGQSKEVTLEWRSQDGNHLLVEIDGHQVPLAFSELKAVKDELEWIIVDGRPLELTMDPCLGWIQVNGSYYRLEIRDLEASTSLSCPGDGRVKAPIPGLITSVFVEEGQEVLAGQPLLVLEAMKMENEIRTSMSGVIEGVHVSSGQSVANQDLLVTIAKLRSNIS